MRKLACFSLAFSAGIFLARYAFPDGAPLSLALAFFCAAALALLLPQGLWRRRLFLCCVALSLALGWDYLFLRQVARPAEALAGTRLEARMTLLTDPEKTAFGARATVRADGVAGKLVYYGGEDLLTLQAGDRLTGEVLLKSARTVRDENLTTFSSRGIFLLAYGRGEMRAERGERTALRYLPQRAARALRERVRLLFDDDVSGLLIGVLTGRKGELSAQAETDLSECGLYHILAVSGMHCGFLLLFVTLFTGRHRRVLRSLLAVPLLLFYALLTGASPSTVRACVMLVFLLAAPLASRQSDPLTALSFALMALLVQNPFAAQSVSLQLSFAAMAGLLCVTSRLYRALTDGERCGALRRALALSVSASVGALVFTAPITAYYFGIFVTVGVLSNLLCLPAAGALFLAGVAAVLLSFVFLPLGRLLALVATVFARYLLGAAHLLAKLPYHAVYLDNPYLKVWLAFAYLLFAILWILRRKQKREYLFALVLSCATLAATVAAGEGLYTARLNAVAVDVGQGACTILKSGKTSAIVIHVQKDK